MMSNLRSFFAFSLIAVFSSCFAPIAFSQYDQYDYPISGGETVIMPGIDSGVDLLFLDGAGQEATAIVAVGSTATWSGDAIFAMSDLFWGVLDVLREDFTMYGDFKGTGNFRKTGVGRLYLPNDIEMLSGMNEIEKGSLAFAGKIGNGAADFAVASGASLEMVRNAGTGPALELHDLKLAAGSQFIFDGTSAGSMGEIYVGGSITADRSGAQSPAVFKGISALAEGDYSRTLLVAGLTETDLRDVFATPLVSVSYDVNYGGDGNTVAGVGAVALTTYATQTGITDPEKLAQVQALEAERLAATGVQRDAYDMLYNATVPDMFNFQNALIDTASQAIPDVLSGMVASRPVGQIVLWRQVDQRMKKSGLVASSLIRGQSCCGPAERKNCSCSRCASKQRDYWGQFYHSSLDVRNSNGFEGYGVSRTGMVIGVNSALGNSAAGGLVFAHSQPFLYDSNERVDLCDYQLGAHLEFAVGDDWEVGFWIGGGMQDNQARRDEVFNNRFYRFNSDFSGGTFSTTLMLSRVFELGKRTTLRPTVAVDSEHAWIDGFREHSEAVEADRGGSLNLAIRDYRESSFGRTMARVGIMGQTNGDRMGLNYKIFYGTQLGGDDSPSSSVALVDGILPGYSQTLRGAPLGRDYINLGIGGHYQLNRKGTWLLFGDYSATLFTHATTQIATLGTQVTW